MEIEGRKRSQADAYDWRIQLQHPPYRQDYYEEYWGRVYGHLVARESLEINQLADSLMNIIIQEGYDHYEAADLAVSMIQDIPYSLIKSDECEDADVKPCIGNQKFGLLAPSEFLYELHGDCDTRAVLLHQLLSKLGYETIVVVSREYEHAMIAIHLPVAGDHIEYKGIPYYFWETTAKGWRAGMLPPSYPQVSYWRVALGPMQL